MVKTYFLISPEMAVTVHVDVDEDKIVRAAPIVRKFVGQPLDGLIRWLKKIGPRCREVGVYPITAYHRVLVCGGRFYSDRDRVYQVLDAFHTSSFIDVLIHGDATGVDRLADQWAAKQCCDFGDGKKYYVEVESYPADWKKYGKAAGPIRNREMLQESKPHCVLAFPGGPGTANMVKLAEQERVPVFRIP